MQAVTITGYANAADAKERDPIIIAGEHGRADVANGRMNKWQRFNKAPLVAVIAPDGRTVYLTTKQNTVYGAVRRLDSTGVRITMRALAVALKVAPSTIYRALVKLAALGLVAYQSNRGRLGGTVFVLRAAHDTLGWFQEAAKAKVRAWAKRNQERFARLYGNVATYLPGRERELVPSTKYIGRNISGAWTPEELRDAGII